MMCFGGETTCALIVSVRPPFPSSFGGIGYLSPHDLRRTAITRALEMGQTYRQVQMMSKHKDPKTVMKYDHGRENLDQNAVNFLRYDEE
jgi:integrase